MVGMGRERQACLALVHCSGLPRTEDEKAEAREFEEDQVAGRLKEDVVRVEAQWWEEGGWAGSGPSPRPLPAARAEGQAAEVGGEGGEWAGHLGVRWEGIGGPIWVSGQMTQLWTQAAVSLRGDMVGLQPGSGFLLGGEMGEGGLCARVRVGGVPSCPQSQ